MARSYWMANQSGNYSNDKNDTFDESKDYIGIRLQQGVPLLDRDINELEDLRRYQDMNMRRHYVGDGTPDNGFEISKNGADLVDFKIGKGRYLVDGIEAICREEITYKKQKDVPALNPANGPRKDLVYIELTILEVDGPKNSQDAEVETCKRQQIQWKVLVNEGSQDLPKPESFKWRSSVALLKRDIASLDIVDLRNCNHGFNRDAGNLTVKGMLTVKKDTTLEDGLAVDGDAEINGEVTAKKLTASEEITAKKLTASEEITAKKLTASEDASVKNLNVTGTIGLNDLNATKAALNRLEFKGESILQGNFTATGKMVLTDSLEIHKSRKEHESEFATAYFSVSKILSPGHAVSYVGDGEVEHTTYKNWKKVIGVIVSKADVSFASDYPGKTVYFVATSGIVTCKVRRVDNPIEVGDLLTCSREVNGIPTNAKKIKVAEGIEIYEPGTIMGKALEGIPSTGPDTKAIKVLLMTA